ncbi:MAG: pilin [Clostridia bacterium]|jgi:NADH:ubiquinone oxidoreductase subunit 6 (subunit J)|nr:pilin [Clostridia bacterium]MDD3862651.1 pilin [Clostridia bacterium]
MYNFAVSILNIKLMFADGEYTDPNGPWAWVNTVVDAIYQVLWPILIVVGAAGMIYAVIIGVNMARADSTEKREEAKKRLVNVIVGLAIIIALILFFQLFIKEILPNLLPGIQEGV